MILQFFQRQRDNKNKDKTIKAASKIRLQISFDKKEVMIEERKDNTTEIKTKYEKEESMYLSSL